MYLCEFRALSARKKSGGENMPVPMIGDILAAELAHMQPYIHFCSCQINGAALLQTRTDNEPDFKLFLKVRGRGGWGRLEGAVEAVFDVVALGVKDSVDH